MSTMSTEHNLPADLRELQVEIEAHAAAYGLDFYDTIFEVLDYDELSEIAALGGFPTRYPHWRFGMEYEQLAKGYRYGLQKIYEMVINNDPCYAYLLRCNQRVDQKLVMAHVYGHNDFFKNNIWFSRTNRKMMDETANHGNRIRSLHGAVRRGDGRGLHRQLPVAREPDRHALAVHQAARRRRAATTSGPTRRTSPGLVRFQSKEYMDSYVNPPEFLKEQAKAKEAEKAKSKQFPETPERDVLLFLLEHAPLNAWQRDVLDIVRQEAYYFTPQGQTKIMNEGWASYWHSTIMTTKTLDPSELVDYADHHSGTMATQPGRLNPYKLGIELFRDIEERWNKGQFGPEYDECDDHEERRRWDKGLGLGPAEDLRGPQDPQRRDLRRHVPDARLLPPPQDVQLQAQRPARDLRDREPRVQEDQGSPAVRPDQLRPADHPGQGRQPPEPGRAVPPARALRDRPEARPRAGYVASPPPPLDAPGPHRDQRRWAAHPLVIRRDGSHDPPLGRIVP